LTITSASQWWGTQQDHVQPAAYDTVIRSGVYDSWECPSGGTVVAIYDSTQDKYVVVDAEKIAMAIEFTTDNALGDLPSAAPATVDHFLGGLSPGATYALSDDSSMFDRAMKGAKGIGIWHNQGAPGASSYAIVNCESKAGELAYSTKSSYTGGTVSVNTIAFWGTQQDVQDPQVTQDVVDAHSLFLLSREGAKGYGIYNNGGDTYNAVYQETFAHHIRYTVKYDFTASDANITATVDEFHSGQEPVTAGADISIRNVNLRADTAGQVGNAYLDTVNSTPTAPVYIDLEPADANAAQKARWGKCVTNWYKGAGKCDYIAVQESSKCDWASSGDSLPFDLTDPNYQNDFDKDGIPTAGYKILLPKVRGCDPNIISGDVIAFEEATDGTYVCVSDYTDDAIGCVKLFALDMIELPGGWTVMNGANQSGIDTSDVLIRGIDGAADDTVSGRDMLPEADMAHHHRLSVSRSHAATNTGDFLTPLLIDEGACMDERGSAYDDYGRTAGVADAGVPAAFCSDAFGPVAIANPHIKIPYIERDDNSQDYINAAP
jgi:hypothetical protein